MSQETRDAVAAKLIGDAGQKSDITDATKTNTLLVGGLQVLLGKHIFQATAIHSDHHPDGYLNPDDPRHTGTHQGGREPDGALTGGFCIDGWPLRSETPDDWMDENSPEFQVFLHDCACLPNLHQIGLAGAAYTDANLAAAGHTVFHDDGDDHIHIGFA